MIYFLLVYTKVSFTPSSLVKLTVQAVLKIDAAPAHIFIWVGNRAAESYQRYGRKVIEAFFFIFLAGNQL